MQPPTIKDITQFFTWFRNYLNSPGGKTALVVLSISTASGDIKKLEMNNAGYDKMKFIKINRHYFGRFIF